MSSNLYYKPVHKADKILPDELKHALRNLDQFNNSVSGTFDENDIPFLRGMECAGVKGARTLIAAIQKYGEVELEEVY